MNSRATRDNQSVKLGGLPYVQLWLKNNSRFRGTQVIIDADRYHFVATRFPSVNRKARLGKSISRSHHISRGHLIKYNDSDRFRSRRRARRLGLKSIGLRTPIKCAGAKRLLRVNRAPAIGPRRGVRACGNACRHILLSHKSEKKGSSRFVELDATPTADYNASAYDRRVRAARMHIWLRCKTEFGSFVE